MNRDLGHDVRSPAMVVKNAVAAAAVPVDRGRTQGRKKVGIRVVCGIRVNLRDQRHTDDSPTAASAEIEDSIADDQYRTVPGEVTIHCQPAGHRQDPIAHRTAGDRRITVDVINGRSREGTIVDRVTYIRSVLVDSVKHAFQP